MREHSGRRSAHSGFASGLQSSEHLQPHAAERNESNPLLESHFRELLWISDNGEFLLNRASSAFALSGQHLVINVVALLAFEADQRLGRSEHHFRLFIVEGCN